MNRHPRQLECLSLTVPEEALEAYEAALECACETVGFFRDHATATWRIEGVRVVGAKDSGVDRGTGTCRRRDRGDGGRHARAPAARTAGWRAPAPRSRSN